MDSSINTILEPQERIIWQGKVSRRPLSFRLFFQLLILGGFSFLIFNFSREITTLFYLLFVALLAGIIFKWLFDYLKIFILTNRRLIIRSGLIGTDYNSISFSKIRTLNVVVDLWEKIFAVGTIQIDTGKIETVGDEKNKQTKTAYDELLYVDEPYKVYQLIQSTISSTNKTN